MLGRKAAPQPDPDRSAVAAETGSKCLPLALPSFRLPSAVTQQNEIRTRLENEVPAVRLYYRSYQKRNVGLLSILGQPSTDRPIVYQRDTLLECQTIPEASTATQLVWFSMGSMGSCNGMLSQMIASPEI